TTDVYGLGATLYALLTGKAPYAGSDLGSLIDHVIQGDFPPPRQIKATVDRPLEAICLKAMATNRQDRYDSCLALGQDIERWLADEPVRAYAEPLGLRTGRWLRKHRALTATAAAVLLTTAIGLGIGLYVVNAEKNHTELARQGEE